MTLQQLFFVVTTATLAVGQRPFFAGSRPIGYPELSTTTTVSDVLGNRFGEDNVTTTTQRLPIEANGDRDLVDRLSKLPIDNQPFWFINWQALEANRNKPQTYPQRPSHFAQPLAPPVDPEPVNVNAGANNVFSNSSPDVTPDSGSSTNSPLGNRNDDVLNTATNVSDKGTTLNPINNVEADNLDRNGDITPNLTAPVDASTGSLGNKFGDNSVSTVNFYTDQKVPSMLSLLNNFNSGNTEDKNTVQSQNPALSSISPSLRPPVQNNAGAVNPLENVLFNSQANIPSNVAVSQPGVNPAPLSTYPVDPYGNALLNYPNVGNRYPYLSNFEVNSKVPSPIRDRPSELPNRYGDDYDFETGIHPYFLSHNQRYYPQNGFVRGGAGYPEDFY